MPHQTILFTVMPRGMSLNTKTLPVSVYVSPRLYGASQLGSFPDWLDWTSRLKEDGLEVTLRVGTKTRSFEIDTGPLRPDLWAAMFKESTFVRSHAYDDYADRTIFSYPVRLALSTIKSIYQQAGLALGLPDRSADLQGEERYSPNRQFLQALLSGLEVNWNADLGEGLRDAYRAGFGQLHSFAGLNAVHYPAAFLNPDGTLNNMPPAGSPQAKNINQFVANQFALYTHMPQSQAEELPPLSEDPPDFDTLIDFHQALSSLNSYPQLLRALGLVFDFVLPHDFVDETPINAPAGMAVVDLPGHEWAIETLAPPGHDPLETAYLYFALGGPPPWRIFTTAPGLLGGIYSDLEVFGLLNLNPTRYGLAQVDVESGMFKNILLAESWQDSRPGPVPSDHPDVFDESTTLPSLRSGGFSLFADGRALRLLRTFQENEGFNANLESGDPPSRPFFAEDLVHGFRLDIWDSFSDEWHSLHLRRGLYEIEDRTFKTEKEEGFTQLAAGQAAPEPENPDPEDDLYLNESVARWNGWSLSAAFPGKALSRDADPDKALDEDPDHPPNEPATPFKMTTAFTVLPSSLPSLRFGRRYRLRARPVDICGNSLDFTDPLANLLSYLAGLPRDPEGIPYLRYEPVVAPSVVLRDTAAVTEPGSQLERLVIRTYNDDLSKDGDLADLAASDRFIVPPGTSVELGERLGMFDDANGKLDTSPGMYALIGERDAGRFDHVEVEVAGQKQSFPLVSDESIDVLPYLPDVLARGAALRDLPGSPDGALAWAAPGAGPSEALPYLPLADANPRPGSAALISFGSENDWQQRQPFLLALADGDDAPTWDPQARLLTVHLPKGSQWLVPLSSYLLPADLKLMGVWQWLREIIDKVTVEQPDIPVLDLDLDVEKIAHLLQRALEGGHWMLTPPRLLDLVHAVQQPLGRPRFSAISAQHQPYGTADKWGNFDEKLDPDPGVLQTIPEDTPTPEGELDSITAWRRPNSPQAFLLGGLEIHAASTGKIDLLAEWSDPVDDPSQLREPGQDYRQANTAQVDEIPIASTDEGFISVGQGGANFRRLAYYDADHDLLCFARSGDELGNLRSGVSIFGDAAPHHHFNDTQYHRVRYTARATSRYREYFPQDKDLDFTRTSQPVVVHVPASARPAAPLLDYIVPTFGWQRQTESNLKRSVRFGGGLRVYLDRPWFSSGDGELLGAVLYDYRNGSLEDRELWKRFVTQWGADPIWESSGLVQLPQPYHFPNAAANEYNLSLPGRAPGRVSVTGVPVVFDFDTQKWFADLTIDFGSLAYMPFIRLALARYQPRALPDAKLSPVVLADFAQLTPERSAVLTADPYHPRRLRLTVSGPAPSGPQPLITEGPQPIEPVTVPTKVFVTLQRRDSEIESDLGWQDAPAGDATITPQSTGDPTGLLRWSGSLAFDQHPEDGQFRLLIREYEYVSANYTEPGGAAVSSRTSRTSREQPKRLIYAEIFAIDAALIGPPTANTGTILEE